MRTGHKSYNDPKNTSSEVTAKQSVAASPENEEIKLVCEAQGKISQTESTGLKQENKANSGVGNKLDGIEANSAQCNTKVINKEWKTHLDQLDQLGVRVNPTVVKVVKSNSSEAVEKAISLLKARKRDGYIPNLAGYFVQALKQNWGSETASTEDSQANFRYWYGMARELGYCQGQELRDGEQWVNLGGVWEKWQSAVERGYSVDYLRKVLGRNKQK